MQDRNSVKRQTYVDLSHQFEKGMSLFGGFPEPEITQYMTREASEKSYAPGCSFEITRASFVTSEGTYMDSPSHRYKGRRDISMLQLNELVRPGILVDLSHKAAREPITRADIETGLAGKGCDDHAVLLWTGWDCYWKTGTYARGPFVSEGAAMSLREQGIKLIGIDTLNIDDYMDPVRPAHSILLGSDCLIVENLCGLGQLKGRQFIFSAAPVRVKGAAAFPVRAYAIVTG